MSMSMASLSGLAKSYAQIFDSVEDQCGQGGVVASRISVAYLLS
jgi:hypothetical protein